MQQQAKEKIKKLVERYKRLSEKEIKKDYGEERTKNVFIQPLFEALGWDFQDDVWPEKEAGQGRADYAFMLGGMTKFFVEAKPLRVNLDIEIHARQAINYSWNKGVAWAVLTDFEGIKIFNAQAQSKLLIDKLVFEIPYSEYISDFDRLWLLSKESFEKNALDQYAIKHGKKIKKLTVNEKLYSDFKKSREILTESFKTWNEDVDKETLDEGVQRILDRLVFIRVLEDKELEKSTLIPMIREWKAKGQKDQLFQLMIKKFRELDDIYNSSLFKKHACEKWVEHDDKIITVVNMLYGSNVYEYDFSKIPADILGGVYESYLGYIAKNPIEVDKIGKSDKLLKVESKKEIKTKSRQKRKEQGIYYTPKFIVDYIVKNTLGKKLEEVKSMHELKKIKVLDPACGSGSFLTKALQTINEKYIDFNNPGKQDTKSEILMSNIYGVDLDPQAIEIAKLNLLVSALDTKAKLPDLTGNVRVGNSLISGSEKELKKYFGKEWREKKSFNWEEEFPFCNSTEKGNLGFDVVIGNPPWGSNIDEEAEYLGKKYPYSTQAYKDIYKIFIDKSISLLKPSGLLGFIVPNTFLYQPRYQDIKEIVDQYENFVINLGERIFSNVQLPACILILKKKKGSNKFVADLMQEDRISLPTKIFLINPAQEQQADKVKESIIKDTELKFDDVLLLKDAGINYQAVNVGKGKKGQSRLGQQLFYEGKKQKSSDVEYWKGVHINKYFIQPKTDNFVRTDYKSFKLENERVILNKAFFELTPKIIWRQTASSIIASVDTRGIWFGRSIIGAALKGEYKNKVDIYYALAVFNSKYIDYIYKDKVAETGKVFPQVKLKYLRDLPFVIGAKKQQKELSELAKKMIKLNKQLQFISENSDKWNSVKKEIEKVDAEIDERVFGLYGLGEEERKIIENN